MNPYFGVDPFALVRMREAFIRRAAEVPEARDLYHEQIDAIEEASIYVPMPERIGLLELDVIDDDPEHFEVAILERARRGAGLEWAGGFVRYSLDPRFGDAKRVAVEWMVDPLGACSPITAWCSMLAEPYLAAVERADEIAECAAIRLREAREDDCSRRRCGAGRS